MTYGSDSESDILMGLGLVLMHGVFGGEGFECRW